MFRLKNLNNHRLDSYKPTVEVSVSNTDSVTLHFALQSMRAVNKSRYAHDTSICYRDLKRSGPKRPPRAGLHSKQASGRRQPGSLCPL